MSRGQQVRGRSPEQMGHDKLCRCHVDTQWQLAPPRCQMQPWEMGNPAAQITFLQPQQNGGAH